MTAPVSNYSPWWAGLGAAELAMSCGGQEHRIRWAEGRLGTPDHPDAERERALVALGGDRAACLDLADDWNEHADDLDLLVLTSRGSSDRLPVPNPAAGYSGYSGGPAVGRSGGLYIGSAKRMRGSRPMGRGWTSYRPLNMGSNSGPVADEDGGDTTLVRLATLGGGLSERLVATVIASWSERIRDGDDRVAEAVPKLQAALYGRLLATIRGLNSQVASVDLIMVGADETRSISAQDGVIHCQLPFAWLSDVWVTGRAAVLGYLCLDVESGGDGSWQLSVADPGLYRTRMMTVSLDTPPPVLA